MFSGFRGGVLKYVSILPNYPEALCVKLTSLRSVLPFLSVVAFLVSPLGLRSASAF